jgi:hypothetical protein
MSLLSYGWEQPCLRCGVPDLARHQVTSHPDVEHMADRLAARLEPLCRDRGRMLGVLRVDGRWVAVLSGQAAVPEAFHAAVADVDPAIATLAHDRYEVPGRSLGGHDIRQALGAIPRLTVARPAQWPGCYCAAPKLLSYWMQPTRRAYAIPHRVHMVELWCGAASATRRHGERAASCATCGRVLSTLLCRAPGGGAGSPVRRPPTRRA